MADYKGCRVKADEILKKYRITKPSIDVFDIAQREGIKIAFFNPQDDTDNNISGFLYYTPPPEKNPVIYLNKQEYPERQIYTVAHELGHFFLEHDPSNMKVLLRNSMYISKKEDIEQEADAFAAELLMPKKMIEKYKKEYDLSDEDEVILAQLFGVSKAAMHARLSNLKRHG